jgi:glutathione S-transferase
MPFAQDLVVLVALLSLVFYLVTIVRVGQARGKHAIKAPAVTGHPDFERAYRIQANTLEQLPVYLAALFLFSIYVDARIAAGLGAVWIIGRVMYLAGYTKAAEQRAMGFLISGLATLALLLGSLGGVIWRLASTG